MAKKTAEVKETKAAAPEFKFTVEDVATAMGIQTASVRVGLRDESCPFERTGSRWGWNTQKELDAVLKYFKTRGDNRPAMTAKDEKPAKAPKAAAKAKAAKAKKAKAVADS